jgi:uncharacterized protein
MKLVVWAVIFVLVAMWLLRGKGAKSGNDTRSAAGNGDGDGDKRDGEAMIRCAHCGVHVPRSEAVVTSGGTSYCSETHRLQHAGH